MTVYRFIKRFGDFGVSFFLLRMTIFKINPNRREKDIPKKFVHAEVLRPDVPKQVAKLAAGQHQRQQHESKDLNTYDIMTMLAMTAESKAKTSGSPFMDDATIYLCLEQLGMVSEAKFVQPKKPTRKSVQEQLVCASPISLILTSPAFPQRDQFLQRYRALAFMVAVAVLHNTHGALLVRVKDLNGFDSVEANDVFKFNLLKDYAGGLTVQDMKAFIDWFIAANPGVLASKAKIKDKLLDLKHYRMTFYHVMHPEGTVPEAKRMLLLYTDSV